MLHLKSIYTKSDLIISDNMQMQHSTVKNRILNIPQFCQEYISRNIYFCHIISRIKKKKHDNTFLIPLISIVVFHICTMSRNLMLHNLTITYNNHNYDRLVTICSVNNDNELEYVNKYFI